MRNISRLTLPSTTGGDLGIGGPDVLQVHVVAVRVGAERLGLEVEVHRAGERVGDDQRRGGQVVHLDVRADAAFEVAVAGKHGGDGQVVGVDRLGNLRAAAGRSCRCKVAQPKPTSW